MAKRAEVGVTFCYGFCSMILQIDILKNKKSEQTFGLISI